MFVFLMCWTIDCCYCTDIDRNGGCVVQTAADVCLCVQLVSNRTGVGGQGVTDGIVHVLPCIYPQALTSSLQSLHQMMTMTTINMTGIPPQWLFTDLSFNSQLCLWATRWQSVLSNLFSGTSVKGDSQMVKNQLTHNHIKPD